MADPTRSAALDLLSAVLDQRRSLDDALERLPPVDARDRAAAHRLAAAVLRRLGSLDAVIEPFLRKAPPDPMRHILRLGAAGLLLLETPAHAAVATAVSLARTRGPAPFAGLVNAVLRRVAAEGPAALEVLDAPRIDTPPWLWASWSANARAIATAHQMPAPIDLTLRGDGAGRGLILANPFPSFPRKRESTERHVDSRFRGNDEVGPQAHSAVGIRLPTGSVRVPAGTRIAELPGYAEGAFWVQDAAAALPAQLLAPRPGERIADLCAAPGGKTAQLAAAGAVVTAVDRDPARAARLRENLRRLRLDAEVVTADAAEWSDAGPFDVVLLDAPCSATGTIRRHPDVPRLKRPQDVAAMTEAQDRLLAGMARLVRPGGRLVYSVCSLQPEEAEPRVRRLLARGGWHLAPFTRNELPELPEAITADGFLRTHPGLWAERGGMDGFFAARLVRM